MTAIEVLEWLKKYEYSQDDMCFKGMDILNVFDIYTPQEILSRIEKYEADHNREVTKKVEPEFKVVDWVKSTETGRTYLILQEIARMEDS